MRVIKYDDKRAGTSFPPSPARRMSRFTSLMVLISTVLLASLLLLFSVTTTNDAARRLKFWLGTETSEYGWDQPAVEGDEYLLGVGKADITGYVYCGYDRDMARVNHSH